MAFSIRNPEANILARRLAELDNTSITDAVVCALKETINNRNNKETPIQSAQRILKKTWAIICQKQKACSTASLSRSGCVQKILTTKFMII
jgi:hypothetical protein